MRGRRPSRGIPVASAVVVVVLLGLAVTIVGGYWLHWHWTGFEDNGTLWDWLNLVLLPISVTMLPLWLRTPHRRRWYWAAALGVLLVGFVVAVVGGYALDWRWTGFRGNTLWDWLRLLLVPAALPVGVHWLTRRQAELQSLRQQVAETEADLELAGRPAPPPGEWASSRRGPSR